MQDVEMAGHDHSMHDHSSHDASMGEGGDDTGMVMMGGSVNMDDPCYTTPSADSCFSFNRSDADWTDDLTQLCSAMPFMIGCSLWGQCQNGTASGTYCVLPSLVGDVCIDMPRMKGCEAYNALCGGNATAVEQCMSPGPIPDVLTTFTAKEGLESLCDTHCMAGCGACGSSGDWTTCTDPLMVLARMCFEMEMMPECGATGFTTMCEDEEVKATFPLVCEEPPAPVDDCA